MGSFPPTHLGLYSSNQARLRQSNLESSLIDVFKIKQTQPLTVPEPAIQKEADDKVEFSRPSLKKKRFHWRQVVQNLLHPRNKATNQSKTNRSWKHLTKGKGDPKHPPTPESPTRHKFSFTRLLRHQAQQPDNPTPNGLNQLA